MLQMADDAEMAAFAAQNGGPRSRLYVEFYTEAVQNEEESEREGRPIFEDQDWVMIAVPGDATNIVRRQVRPKDTQDFAQQYAAFKAKKAQPLNGTPLAVIPFLTKAQVREFEALNIRTAEALRDMPDSAAQKFMGINEIRKRITDYLSAAAGAAPLLKMRSELEKRDSEILSLQNALNEMAKKVEELQKRR